MAGAVCRLHIPGKQGMSAGDRIPWTLSCLVKRRGKGRGNRQKSVGKWGREERKEEGPLVVLPAGGTGFGAPPSSLTSSHCGAALAEQWEWNPSSPPAWQGWAHFLQPHRKECFLVLAVWYPQGMVGSLGLPRDGRLCGWS